MPMKILCQNLKAKNQFKHTQKRFEQRYGKYITKDQYVSMCAQIRAGNARFIKSISKRKNLYWITLHKNDYPVMYDRFRGTIITVYLCDWIDCP